MSEEPSKTPRRFRWWFWLVLFTPALVVISAPFAIRALHIGIGVFMVVSGLVLNFFCSNWAAKQIVLLRDSRGSSSPWMFLWGPLCFVLNAALAFGGCVAAEQIAPLIR